MSSVSSLREPTLKVARVELWRWLWSHLQKSKVDNKQVGVAVTLWTCIRKALGWNLGRDTAYLIEIYHNLSQSLRQHAETVPRLGPYPCPSKCPLTSHPTVKIWRLDTGSGFVSKFTRRLLLSNANNYDTSTTLHHSLIPTAYSKSSLTRCLVTSSNNEILYNCYSLIAWAQEFYKGSMWASYFQFA
jgi:hypothetical protein